MKQLTLILFFLTGIFCSVKAQYNVTQISQNLQTGICSYSIAPDPNFNNGNPVTWTQYDLITWIFPDGQIIPKTINLSNSTMIGDIVDWMPSRPINNEPVTAIVTKKGDTGNPGYAIVETTILVTYTGPFNANSPVPITFPQNANWMANYTWDFSPGHYSYMVISYRSDSGCAFDNTSQFTVTLPAGVNIVGNNLFNLGTLTGASNGPLSINLFGGGGQRNLLLKLQVNSTTVDVGDPLNIIVSSNTCGPASDTLEVIAKTVPHDPNQKMVNIKRICKNKPSTKLHYWVQFHNDGTAPVKKVQVTDCLPSELIPSSFVLTTSPTMNGLYMQPFLSSGSSNPCKTLDFLGQGLPGLGQTNQIYFYSQTIYAFEFDVMTTGNLTKDIDNVASVIFYNDTSNGSTVTYTPQPAITTNIERVYVGCEKPSFCHCFKMLFCRKCNRPKP